MLSKIENWIPNAFKNLWHINELLNICKIRKNLIGLVVEAMKIC